MKIGLVCPASLPATQFGGIMFLCLDIARGSAALGHNITIYTTDLDFANNATTFNKNLPRKEIIDNLAGKPFIRKVVLRLPESIQPSPDRHGFVLGIDGDGQVIHNLQDPSSESFSPITSVEEKNGILYLGSLTYPGFARISAPE